MTESFVFLLITLAVAVVILLFMYLSTKQKLDSLEGQIDSKAQDRYGAWRQKELESEALLTL